MLSLSSRLLSPLSFCSDETVNDKMSVLGSVLCDTAAVQSLNSVSFFASSNATRQEHSISNLAHDKERAEISLFNVSQVRSCSWVETSIQDGK